jgi:hypothetical protein
MIRSDKMRNYKTLSFIVKDNPNHYSYLEIPIDKIVAIYDHFNDETELFNITIDLVSGLAFVLVTDNENLGIDLASSLDNGLKSTTFEETPEILEIIRK